MQKLRNTYQQSLRGISLALMVLFGMHILSIHSFAETLVLCFEENGQVNIESEIGSLFSIPAEEVLHQEHVHEHNEPTFGVTEESHNDIPFSRICSKEQQTTRFDQKQTLKFLNGILNTTIEELPRSRVFQLAAFIPPLIEDLTTANLRTVVLLN